MKQILLILIITFMCYGCELLTVTIQLSDALNKINRNHNHSYSYPALMASAEANMLAKQFNAPSAGKAGVYIYCQSNGATARCLWIDGEFVGTATGGVFFYHELPAGKHIIVGELVAGEKVKQIEITVEEGSIYFVRLSIIAHLDLGQVANEDGEKIINDDDFSLAVSGHCMDIDGCSIMNHKNSWHFERPNLIANPVADAQAKQFNTPSTGNAGLYIYNMDGDGNSIWLDGTCVGLNRDWFFYYELPAGKHILSNSKYFARMEALYSEIELEEYNLYFVTLKNDGQFVTIPTDEGKEAVSKLRLAVNGGYCEGLRSPEEDVKWYEDIKRDQEREENERMMR
jgi:hypothetical protein